MYDKLVENFILCKIQRHLIVTDFRILLVDCCLTPTSAVSQLYRGVLNTT